MRLTCIRPGFRWLALCLAAVTCVLASLAAAAPAPAEEPKFLQAPWWRVNVRPAPAYLPESGEAKIVVGLSNLGNGETSGPITITDKLPPNVHATKVLAYGELFNATSSEKEKQEEEEGEIPVWKCSVASPQEPTCTYASAGRKEPPLHVPPYERLELEITVKTEGAKSGEQQTVTVEGGGAPTPPPLTRPIRVAPGFGQAPFGIERMAIVPEEAPSAEGEEGGKSDTQAGSTPFQLTTYLDFNQSLESYPGFATLANRGKVASAPKLLRDLKVELPPGLLGDVNALAQCSDRDFSTNFQGNFNACSPDTAVGVASATILEPNNVGEDTRAVPIFNLVPAFGEPARFGFVVEKSIVYLTTSVVPSGPAQPNGEYRVAVTVANTTQAAQVLGATTTFWGEPGNPAHDNSRGWPCLVTRWRGAGACVPPTERPTKPFLRLPTSCGPMETTLTGRSWPTIDTPGGEQLPAENTTFTGESLTGCEELPFSPELKLSPDTSAANTPTGLTAEVTLPQAPSLELGARAEADIKETTITLPEGVLVNPGSANGLSDCTDMAERGRPDEILLHTNLLALCSNASTVGTMRIQSPFLPQLRDADGKLIFENGKPVYEELEGSVFLAAQNSNPFGSLVALYIVAESPKSNLRVKLAGEIHMNEQTGQITSSFKNTPQLPFEHLKVEFFHGPRATVTTPPVCGTYTTAASVGSWSGKQLTPTVEPFSISSGPEGAGCSNPLPFAPGFAAGTTNNQAGGFTPFSLTITHRDSDQPLSSITLHLPTGLAAQIASVTPCPEPQASQGTCGPDSLIGKATSSSGLGADPFTLTGQVYLTGPYNGAPFGVSIVTPAIAGPFNLGKVIVRSSINVDPYTAAVTITSAVPTWVETAELGKPGIPVQLKQTNVETYGKLPNGKNFQFNPTNCTPTAITATLGGAQGATANVASPLQVANCNSLPFKPGFEAEVTGQGSKPKGVTFKVITTSSGFGQAGIAKVFVALPIQLPSRLSTIQKACRDFQFEANPVSGCPPDSNIGSATIRTPVFKNPLSGPAYLVSHGNAGFPDVEFVLRGEGLMIILDGKTDIKKGITYSRFESTPDAPFTRFETTLPAGPHSALTANVRESKNFNLCGEKLVMPTEIYGQNGVKIKQNTKVKITGCKPSRKCTTRACKLKAALKKCHKLKGGKNRKKRVACERAARKKYGANKAKKKHKRK